jgi:hypothetical protein
MALAQRVEQPVDRERLGVDGRPAVAVGGLDEGRGCGPT